MNDAPPLPRIALVRCAACERVDTSARAVCSACLHDVLEPFALPGVGALVSWTTIRRAPVRFRDEAPYDIAVVDLDDGPRIAGRLAADSLPPQIGARVRAQRADGADVVFTVEG